MDRRRVNRCRHPPLHLDCCDVGALLRRRGLPCLGIQRWREMGGWKVAQPPPKGESSRRDFSLESTRRPSSALAVQRGEHGLRCMVGYMLLPQNQRTAPADRRAGPSRFRANAVSQAHPTTMVRRCSSPPTGGSSAEGCASAMLVRTKPVRYAAAVPIE